MADTIADVVLTGTAFQDLNTATGIGAGTDITIQNKTSQDIFIAVSATQPTVSASSENQTGALVTPSKNGTVTGELNKVWAFGKGPISVQAI